MPSRRHGFLLPTNWAIKNKSSHLPRFEIFQVFNYAFQEVDFEKLVFLLGIDREVLLRAICVKKLRKQDRERRSLESSEAGITKW
jgi:hypothetical protein